MAKDESPAGLQLFDAANRARFLTICQQSICTADLRGNERMNLCLDTQDRIPSCVDQMPAERALACAVPGGDCDEFTLRCGGGGQE